MELDGNWRRGSGGDDEELEGADPELEESWRKERNLFCRTVQWSG